MASLCTTRACASVTLTSVPAESNTSCIGSLPPVDARLLASTAADWNVTGPALERVARATWLAIEHRLLWVGLTVDDDVPVAVEGYVYQGHRGEGRSDNKHFWKGAAVTGALAATRPAWATIRWANANDVLRHGGGGYGDLRDYLAAGKAKGVDPARLVRNEHVASAVCHALHMEAAARITRLPV